MQRLAGRLLLLVLLSLFVLGFSCRHSTTPPSSHDVVHPTTAASTTAPVAVDDDAPKPQKRPAETRPVGGYSVAADTVLLHGGPDGKPIYEPIAAGTRVVLTQPLPTDRPDAFVQVRTADGMAGSIPLARLKLSVVVTTPKPIVATTQPDAPPKPEKPDPLRDAVERGLKYLIARQNATGSWESVPAPVLGAANLLEGEQWGLTSATATWALVENNSPYDKPVSKGLNWLADAKDVAGTYAVAARCEALAKLHKRGTEWKRFDEVRKRESALLIKGARVGAGGQSAYGYDLSQPNAGTVDPLATMFAQRAVYHMLEWNREVPDDYWKSLQVGWDATQSTGGGWSRAGKGQAPSPAETLIGISAIEAVMSRTASGRECKGNASTPTGRAWESIAEMRLRDLVPLALKPGAKPEFQTLSHMLLIQAASERGVQGFGDENVFREAICELITSQNKDGSFGKGDGASAVVDTAFAVIALSAFQEPVLISKLADLRPDWNQRPFDARRFALWLGPRMCWTTGYSQQVRPKQLLNIRGAPLLLMAGSKAFEQPHDEVRALREFIEAGGMIFANPDCGSRQFAKSVESLGEEMFDYKFRDLPQDHQLFKQFFQAPKWKTPIKLRGMSNGVRELIVLNDNDIGQQWDAGESWAKQEFFEFGANLVWYLYPRGNISGPSVRETEQERPRLKSRGTIRCARLIVGSNPDPEPYGWRRMQRIMNEQCAQDLIVTHVVLGRDRLAGLDVAHLTGTGKFTLTPEERTAVSEFVGAGGVLLIDAAGGFTEFANAALAELQTMFGPPGAKQLADPLSKDHALFRIPNLAIDRVEYTIAARNAHRRGHFPNLRGIDINGRTAIFFSEEDLSGALVGRLPAGVAGYEPDSATAIVRNVLLYSTQRNPE